MAFLAPERLGGAASAPGVGSGVTTAFFEVGRSLARIAAIPFFGASGTGAAEAGAGAAVGTGRLIGMFCVGGFCATGGAAATGGFGAASLMRLRRFLPAPPLRGRQAQAALEGPPPQSGWAVLKEYPASLAGPGASPLRSRLAPPA